MTDIAESKLSLDKSRARLGAVRSRRAPWIRVKRSRASAPHRREPPGTGDALRM